MLQSALTDVGGIEVRDIDLGADIDDARRQELMDLFDEHGLVVFRDQRLTQEQLAAATELFGGLGYHHAVKTQISIISTRTADGVFVPSAEPAIGKVGWHSDQAYVCEPNRGKLLYAREVPPEGGMTGFIDGQRTYDTLPQALKKRIEGLHVIQSWRHAQDVILKNRKYRPDGEAMLSLDRFPDVVYPMVRTHPRTGRKILNAPPLWVSEIAEIPGEEGRALLDEVFAHMLQPHFEYWHRYQPDDVVLWDNWRFLHAASGTPGQYPRTLWSVAIHGGVEMGAAREAA